MAEPVCDTAGCGNSTAADSVFDRHFKKHICLPCYNTNFRTAQESGFGEWFEANFKDNKTAYPPEFWRSVGAFVDLTQANIGSPYK